MTNQIKNELKKAGIKSSVRKSSGQTITAYYVHVEKSLVNTAKEIIAKIKNTEYVFVQSF